MLGLGNSITSLYTPGETAYTASASWDFDGTDDHVNFGNSSTIKLIPTDTSEETGITVSCWVYRDDWGSVSSAETFFSCEQYGLSSADGKGWGMYLSSGDVRVYFTLDTAAGKYTHNTGWKGMAAADGSCTAANTYCRASNWHLMTMTFDGRYFRSYVDAIAVTVSDTGADDTVMDYGTDASDVDVMLGADPYVNVGGSGTSTIQAPWEGLINEGAIWNKALDADAIQEILDAVNVDGAVLDLTKDSGSYDYSENLVGLWRASEAEGTTAVDVTGNNNGTIKNDTGTSTSVPS